MPQRLAVRLAIACLLFASSVFGSSTADDPKDPAIAAKAAALGKDPSRIYAFVRDEIGFAVYAGSVRGARGTLADGGGNALDRASLLVALLGASGVPARYVQGTLPFADAQKVVDQMIPARLRALGCPPGNVGRANPMFSNLPNEIYPLHYWVEFGAGNTPADPSLRSNALGTITGTAGARFAEIPENVKQKVTVRLLAETYNQAGALFGFGPSSAPVLTREFPTAELYGRPLSVGHFVTSTGLDAPVVTARTYTYSPYLLVGDPYQDLSKTPLIQGTDFVENVTNFPLSSTILTGLFLEIDALDRTGVRKTYRQTMLDRIGPNTRAGGGQVSVNPGAGQGPAVSDADITTVHVLTGRQPLEAFGQIQTRLAGPQNQLTPLIPAVTAITQQQTPITASQKETLRVAGQLSRLVAIATNELAVSAMAGASDRYLAQLETTILSKAWYGTPRLIVSSTRFDGSNLSVSMNLLKRDLSWSGAPGQNVRARIVFEILRGYVDSALEGKILSGITGGTARSIDRLFQAIPSPNDITFFGPANIDYLRSTELSPAAKARITEAVAGNRFIITPRKMVTLDGQQTVGWFETDPATGETVSTFEDGTHGALFEYVSGQLLSTYSGGANGNFIGKMHGIGQAGIIFAAGVLNGIANAKQFSAEVAESKGAMAPVTESLYFKVKDTYDAVDALIGDFIPIETPDSVTMLTEYVAGFKDGFELGRDWFSRFAGVDPEVPSYLTRDLSDGPAPVAPGATPGVKLSIVPDALSFVRRGAEELATVFTMRVQNTGPAETTFILGLDSYPQGFSAVYGLDRFTIPAGQTAEASLCLYPTGKLPAPGATIAFTPTVRDLANTIADPKPQQFPMPLFGTVDTLLAPASKALLAGQQTQTDFSITSAGNVAQGAIDVTATVPAGLTLAGLSTPVTLTPGQTAVQRLTIGTAAGLAPGTRLGVPIRVSWGTGSGRRSITRNFVVTVSTAGTQCARTGAPKATNAGRTGLGTLLRDFATVGDELTIKPEDAAKKAELVALMDAILAQLDVVPISGVTANLQAARNTLRTAGNGEVPGALNTVGTAMCQLDVALDGFPSETFETIASPNAQVAIAGKPATFTIYVQNKAARPRTFRVAAANLPSGVTATFTTTEFTIEANTDTNNSNMFGFIVPRVTLTAAAAAAPFNVDIVVTPVDAPSTARTVKVGLTPRAEFAVVDNVVATPGSGPVGTAISFSGRVFNAVNQNRTVNATYRVKNRGGQVFAFDRFVAQLDLTQAAPLVNFTVATPLNTTGFPEGAYTIEVTLTDANENLGVLNTTLGTGTFFLGPPISGTLRVTPNVLGPQGGVVSASLQLNRETAPTPLATLVGNVPTTSRAQSFVRNGNIAYVCGDKAITIVDVTDPANLVVKGTFGQAQLGTTGYLGTPCTISNNHLFVSYGRENGNSTANFLPTQISSYNLANPLAPVFVATAQIQRQDPSGLQALGTTGYATTQGFFYNPFSRFIFQFHGQYFTLNLANPASPAEAGALFPPTAGLDPRLGGPNPVYSVTAINATTVLLTMSTTDQNPAAGVGRALIVDITNAAAPTIKATLDIPGTRLVYSAAVSGNTAILLGDTVGYYDAVSGLTGQLTITALDISNLNAPMIRQTVTTQLIDKDFATVIALSANQFVAGGATLNGDPLLLLIDASAPAALRYVPYKSAVPVYPAGANGNYFYTISTAGLSTYQLSFINGPQLTATIQVPKGTGVTPVAGSFVPAPTAVKQGTAFDSYEWTQPTSDLITFNLNVTGLNAGSPKTVLNGGSLDFTLPVFGPGTFPLPPVTVITDHVITIDPAFRAVSNSQTANYTLTVKNPTAESQTYTLGVTGIPSSWFPALAPIPLAAGAQTTVPFPVTPDKLAAAFGLYQIGVTARSAAVEGTTYATLRMNSGYYAGSNAGPGIVRLLGTLSPPAVVLGRGTSAMVDVVLENTGTVQDFASVFLTAAGGVNGSCTPAAGLALLPGSENRKVIRCKLTAATNAAPGTGTYTANLGSFSGGQQVQGTYTLAAQGVTVSVTQNGSRYDARITNTGTAQDTFNLVLYGPVAPVSALGATTVTLAAGASQTVPVTVGGLTGFGPGDYELRVGAISQANNAVLNSGTANVTVSAATTTEVSLTPASTTLTSVPGTANLLLTILNRGNVAQSYELGIQGVTGPLSAAVDSPSVTLPAFGIGEIPVPATLSAAGTGTVTVRVKPAGQPELLATATVTKGDSPPPVVSNLAPVANPGPNRTMPARRKAVLDGSASSDPDSGPQALTYSWTLLSKPPSSQLTQAGVTAADTVRAEFRPDVLGTYVFRLTVSDGKDAGSKDVSLEAVNGKPVANPGPAVLSAVERAVTLDGSESYDPDNDRISFLWTLVTAPAGSRVTAPVPAWSPRPYVIPDRAGDYVFRLVVRDSALESEAKEVTLRAFTGNVPPVVNAGRSERPGRVGEVLVIRPTARDLDGPNALRWSATVQSGGVTTEVTTVNAATGETTFTPPSAGKHLLRISAFDGMAMGTAELTVNALAAGQALPPYGNRVLIGALEKTTTPLPPPFPTAGYDAERTLAYRPQGSAVTPLAISPTGELTTDTAGVYLVQLSERDDRFERLNFAVVSANACDADLDGAKTGADAELIRRFIGETPLPGLDPRDANRDGKIDQADVTFCTPEVPVVVPPSPPYIDIDPKLVEFTWQKGSPLPGPKTIFVEGDVTAYQASVIGKGIVQVTPTHAVLPFQNKLTVSLLSSVTLLASGRYEDIVTVTSTSAGQTQQARVVLLVTDIPQLLTSQQPIVFRYTRGGGVPAPQLLYVTATVRPIPFSAEVAQGEWLQVNPNITQIPANITVRVNPFGMAPGTYTGRIRISSAEAGNSPKEVPVTLIID